MRLTAPDLAQLHALLGDDGVLAGDAALFTYETDALAIEKHRPDVVVLPRSTDEVAAIVRWAAARGVPVTARGAGTGLAGGATPEHGGIVLSLNRMTRVLRLDTERMFAWVQPGMVNLWLSQHLAPHGLYYAPDPASQQVSTVGGNVATNAGGPHCLKYGVTLNHVIGLVTVLADGTVVTLGDERQDGVDADLASVVVGSEGTLGIVTEIAVRLLPRPAAVRTMLFDFGTIEEACRSVSAVIATGIVPAAMEIIDRHTVGLVEAWLHIGLPLDAAGVLLIEVDGPAESLERQVTMIGELARANGARSTRVAKDEAERALIWRGRKSAFGAYGRTASGFYIMDGVVPRTRLAEALAGVYRMAAERGLEAGNVFHAGDGNLHPHILFDAGDPAQQAAALAVSHEILRMCIRMGGTISGEHGVGIEKRPMMRELFAPADLDVMHALRQAFDPDRRLNPGKILPGGGGCGETHESGDPVESGVRGTAMGEGVPAQLGGRTARADVEGPWI
ncbi:MAG: FAD-binding oxidoreductase [Candidatus Eisenbacteria bacterium]